MKRCMSTIMGVVRKAFIAIVISIFSAVSLSPSIALAADKDVCTDRRLRDLQIAMISCKEEECAPPTALTIGGGLTTGDSVYILGDSITHGLAQKYIEAFSAKGITTTISAVGGRAWTLAGIPNAVTGTPGTGKQAVETDSTKIQSAKGIIVALGSNGGNGSNPVSEVIDSIRTKNPSAPIWWVNTAGSSKYPQNLGYLGPFNKTLAESSSVKNFRIIDWLKVVNPNGDPSVSPTVDNANMLGDGLHPSPAGGAKLVELVVSSTTSSTVESGAAATNTGAPGGTANPYHTVVYPSALNSFTDQAISGAINKYITDRKPQSPFAKLGGDFVTGGKASQINPFLAVAHLEIESGFATAPSGWHTIPGSNNAFGRTATDAQPHVLSSGGRKVYKWSSWSDSLSGSESWFVYLKRKVDSGTYPTDIDQYIHKYAPPGDGNDTANYIANVKKTLDALATLAGDPNIASYASSGSTSGASCTCDVPAATSLTGVDNQEKAFRYFLGKSLTAEQSAAVVGNMMLESGVDPELVQGSTQRTKDPSSVGDKAWGIIQWKPGGKIINVAQQAGISTPIHELSTQLDIVWWHMGNTSPTGAKDMLTGFRQISDVNQAVIYFEQKIEGSGGQALARRQKFAQDILASYGGSISSSSAAGSSATSSGNCAGGNGQNTQFVDGNFIVYNQGDPQWANHPYGSSTVKVSGCGPSAMAMIVTNLTGQHITPDQVADVAAQKGMYVSGSGSSWSIGQVVAQHYGLKSEPLQKDIAAITAALQAGKLVIAPGQGAKPFTSGGHFIVIRGITADGKFKVGDSGHRDTSDKDWDPAPIIRDMRNGGIYAISK